ncbi:MAG: chloride channel protein [Bacteroidetes bacterium]|nr:chloride channel protein [Bacteroidota bacterium]
MERKKIINRLFIWRLRHISNQRFVLILSLVIGLLSGLAAVLLKNTAFYTHYLLTFNFSIDSENYWYLAYPTIGILLTVLYVKYFVKDKIGHGVSRVLYAISKNGGRLKPHNNYSSMIASTLTVAFGGSVGLEAPIVATGSSIGSSLGQLFRLNYKTTVLLIGCGAAGAIAGIFKAPIAGIVFVIEVLMLDLTTINLIPLLISAITASSLSYFLMGKGVLFSFDVTTPFFLKNIPFFIILGIVSGLISFYFTKISMKIEELFKQIKNQYYKIIIGGVTLGVLIFIFPSLYGEGYDVLNMMLHGKGNELLQTSFLYFLKNDVWLFSGALLAILFFKVVAMAVTNGSGGVGGIFAPSLFMGGITGFFVARTLNIIGIAHVSEINFALVGMAGIMSGVMHSPLTAIFLIAEITGGYQLFTPLIITSTISYLTISQWEPHSIYTKRLAQRGELITHDKDKAVLTLMKIDKLIETNFCTIFPEANLKDLVEIISKSNRNIFPVVDKDNNFKGVVVLDDIRHLIFDSEKYQHTFVKDLLIIPPYIVDCFDTMEIIVHKFNESGNYNLPVTKEGKYVGFVSRANIFSAYRKMLKHFSDD